MSPGPCRELTSRQEQIAVLVAQGLTAKQIAARMNTETSTVRSQIAVIARMMPNPENVPAARLIMRWVLTRG